MALDSHYDIDKKCKESWKLNLIPDECLLKIVLLVNPFLCIQAEGHFLC